MNTTTETRTVGQIGYDAYRAFSGGKSLASGSPIPEFDALSAHIKEAWEVAANHICASVGRGDAR